MYEGILSAENVAEKYESEIAGYLTISDITLTAVDGSELPDDESTITSFKASATLNGRLGTAVALYAIYEGDELMKLGLADTTYDASSKQTTIAATLDVSNVTYADATKIKLFIWDSLINAKPIMGAKEQGL